MSGGVDSAVAAALLQREGHEVIGCFMRLGSAGEPDEGPGAEAPSCEVRLPVRKQGCCSVNDAGDARLVAARLGVPFYALNFERSFHRVIDYFMEEYHRGRTPNPCVRCNDWLKFGRLHQLAKDLGADYVASGHYARTTREPDGRVALRRGVDAGKDQSYVLFGVPEAQLGEMLLPIGERRKPEVRALAAELGLPVSEKPDSQEICFVPDQDYAGLLSRRAPERVQPGRILDESGADLGPHAGHQHFTVGQRRGIPLAVGTPLFVLAKDPRTNTITVGPRERLLRRRCVASAANWLLPPWKDERPVEVKFRSAMEPVPGRVRATEDGGLEVRFDAPQEAPAPGQAIVCYDGDRVVCGGWIDAAPE